MKSGTTLTGISGTFSALGLRASICGVSCPGGVRTNGICANRVVAPADSDSAAATRLRPRLFIGHLESKCRIYHRIPDTTTRSGEHEETMKAWPAAVFVFRQENEGLECCLQALGHDVD